MRKRYPLNQSPLYKLQSRRRLAELLAIPLAELESIANSCPPEYKCFKKLISREGKPPKERFIEWPRRQLQCLQRRLARLLDRIDPPVYIHSGFRGTSYLTNAAKHDGSARIAKIDIRRFFPSSSAMHVLTCFIKTFACSEDVAQLLTKLVVVWGHLPTGGSTSSIVSFYAYKPMFDEIHQLACSSGLVMSCCVDDMTFSGERATSGFLNTVRVVVERFGLKIHKRHCFEGGATKVVTGVALTPKGARLPNSRRMKLHLAAVAFTHESDPLKKIKRGEEFLGRAVEASQIEKQFEPLVQVAAKGLSAARKTLRRQ